MTVSENQKRILQMLAEGKVSVEEASRLLSLINKENGSGVEGITAEKEAKPLPKFLYVRVEPKEGAHCQNGKEGYHSMAEHGRVNIRIPMGLIRAGIKLKALIPPQVAEDINKGLKEKGISFDIRDLKDDYLESLVAALGESEINVDSEEAEIRIHAE
jgi:hypothetical protein